MRFWILLVVGWVSCMPNNESQVKTNQGGADQQSWFKTPEEIKSTIEGYGIIIEGEAQLLYFDKLSELYGSKNIRQHKTMLVEPNGLYLLALDALSNWLSCKLLAKEDEEQGAIFSGSWLTADKNCDACYNDKDKPWCDCDDEITLGSSFVEGKEFQKRIMHNIQDIGEFLGMAIDDKLLVQGFEHAADYLYRVVFIPNRDAENSCNTRQQQDTSTVDYDEVDKQKKAYPHLEAWRKVIHAILMSGPFYLNLDNRE